MREILDYSNLDLTSGKPLGKRKASGTRGNAVDLCFSDGGEELAVYSVKDKPLSFGVCGVCVPLTTVVSTIALTR